MSNLLHILNGDGTAHVFAHTTLPGDHVVWREMLMAGPLGNGQDDAEGRFRQLRSDFLVQEFEAAPGDYAAKVAPALDALSEPFKHTEFVLWFEFDLFCQANLLYLLHHLASRLDDPGFPVISLVSPADFPGVPHFRGMGQLHPEQLSSLFPNRTVLTAATLRSGAEIWRDWCSPDPLSLNRWLEQAPAQFPHLQKALEAQLRRFPSLATGRNAIGDFLYAQLSKGSRGFAALFRSFCRECPVYGLGDLQFLKEIEGIPAIHEDDEGYRWQEASAAASPAYAVGNVAAGPEQPYRWDAQNGRLVRI